jgi:hypothetical protein
MGFPGWGRYAVGEQPGPGRARKPVRGVLSQVAGYVGGVAAQN